MGFFADIIRDSRREGVAVRTPEAPVPRGGEEVPFDAPVAAEGAPAAPAAATGSDASVIRLREEGGGTPVTAGQRLTQAGAVARQVVSPSLSEHTPVAGIPDAVVKGVVLPNPGKREQAGSESDRLASDDFRVEPMESFHDGGSIDVPVVSVSENDSFVRKSSSGYAALQAEKVSVETQGRRQAAESRAGSTTPPEPLAGTAVEEDSPQGFTKSEARSSRHVSGEAVPLPAIAENPVSPAIRAEQVSRPDGAWEEGSRAAVSPERESAAEETRQDAHPEVFPVSASLRQGQVPLLGEPLSRKPERPAAPPEPQVRIGTIEVVVVAPAPAERPSRSDERSRPDLASRHYLRNF